MIVSTVREVFPNNIREVWDVVTSIDKFSWRSDIAKVDIISSRQFVEYSMEGTPTYFSVTAIEPLKRWEFDMGNNNMEGHWAGEFTYKYGRTTVEFTEEIKVKKWFMKPFARRYIKKQQETYMRDLRKALSA